MVEERPCLKAASCENRMGHPLEFKNYRKGVNGLFAREFFGPPAAVA
jgi:hypothetical protein